MGRCSEVGSRGAGGADLHSRAARRSGSGGDGTSMSTRTANDPRSHLIMSEQVEAFVAYSRERVTVPI